MCANVLPVVELEAILEAMTRRETVFSFRSLNRRRLRRRSRFGRRLFLRDPARDLVVLEHFAELAAMKRSAQQNSSSRQKDQP